MILIIDNYDSFTYNLVQRLGEIDDTLEIKVVRNDKVTLEEIESLAPQRLIVSPGPCTPDSAGISVESINRFHGSLPILGVCLGHQSIGQATGGKIVSAKRLMHGKTDQIYHDGAGIFAGLPNPMTATRYHSLVIRPDTLCDDFVMTAWANGPDGEKEIMGIQHKMAPTYGLQFHPESFLTTRGIELLENFLRVTI